MHNTRASLKDVGLMSRRRIITS